MQVPLGRSRACPFDAGRPVDRPLFYASVVASATMGEEGTTRPTVGLVGTDDAIARAAREAADRTVACDATSTPPEEVDVLVASGEDAVSTLARRRPAGPILPVAAGAGLRSVPESAVTAALARYGTEDWETVALSLLSVAVAGQATTALLDACLVTAEPARISEFTVTAADQQVATVRADGIVAATPAGTRGYARAVGTPVVPPGPAVLAVAPIAPFQTDPDTWVLPAGGVTVTVERDATPVAVLADDREVAEVGAGEPVEFAMGPSIRTVVVPESTSPFARADAELEKH